MHTEQSNDCTHIGPTVQHIICCNIGICACRICINDARGHSKHSIMAILQLLQLLLVMSLYRSTNYRAKLRKYCPLPQVSLDMQLHCAVTTVQQFLILKTKRTMLTC